MEFLASSFSLTPTLAVVAILGVNQLMEDFCISLAFTHSTFQISKYFFKKLNELIHLEVQLCTHNNIPNRKHK